MNLFVGIGRLTRDPEVRYSETQNGQMAIARYTIAINRRGGDEADFIYCVAFGKNGEFAEKYLHKGMKIGIKGRIQTGSYTNKEGQKIYTTDVVVEEHEFCESKGTYREPSSEPSSEPTDGFMNIPDGLEEELPFN